MIEREMEDLLYLHPDLLLGEPLKPVSRQSSSAVGRADLVFEHSRGYRVVVEVKAGVAPRGVGEQLHDYWGAEKLAHPDVPVEMMVVANEIPRERRLYLENRNIEPREIPAKKFRDVALAVGYSFASEETHDHKLITAASPKVAPAQRRANTVAKPLVAETVATGKSALFVILTPANLDSMFDCFREPRDKDLLIGTRSSLKSAQIGRVYFKAKGKNEVSARAEVARIIEGGDLLPDPGTRLPGFEEHRDDWYMVIRNPERLDTAIPVGDFIYFSTGRNLRNDAQGVFPVFDPDPSSIPIAMQS